MKRIGIYGGTFDPIHHGHLILAREAIEQLQLARIIFVPAALSPHKLAAQPTAAGTRLEMLRAAIAEEPGFELDTLELERPPPSFAFDTVEEFRRREVEAEIFYLIGADNLDSLATWHRFPELEKLVRFVVLDRALHPATSEHLHIHRSIDISATEIRNRVAAGRSVRYLVPSAVEEIIRRQALYQEPPK